MNGPGAWICGIGMATPVGGCAVQTATSVQAGISRYADTFVDDDETPVTMALLPDDWLPPLNEQLEDLGLGEREERMLRLAGPAIAEAMAGLPERQIPPLLLAIPEPMPELPLDIDETVLDHLMVQTGLRLHRQASQIVPSGRAAGLMALHSAIAMLGAGAEYALLGGMDTFLDAEVLSTLEEEGRLLMEGALDGFAPGEGAAFLLLGADAAIERDGLTRLAFVNPPGLAHEPGHRYSDVPFRGEGLAAAVSAALGYCNGQRMRSVLCSLNGEQLGAKEWGVAVIRNHAGFDDDPMLVHPADCFGDVGAAIAPVLIGLAAIGLWEGYLPGPALVWCASDAELRGAVCVQPAVA